MASPRRMGSPEAKNRAALLDAAEQIMLEEGYPGAGTDGLPRAADVGGDEYTGRAERVHHRRVESRTVRSHRALRPADRSVRHARWQGLSTDRSRRAAKDVAGLGIQGRSMIRAGRARVAAAMAALLLGGGCTPPFAQADPSDGVAINGTYTVFSDGQWARDRPVVSRRSERDPDVDLTSACSTFQDCAGRVTSDQGWSGDLMYMSGRWKVTRTVPDWEPCQDGTAVPGELAFILEELPGPTTHRLGPDPRSERWVRIQQMGNIVTTLIVWQDPIMNWAPYAVYNPQLWHWPEDWPLVSLSPTVEPFIVIGYVMFYFGPYFPAIWILRKLQARRPVDSFVWRHPLISLGAAHPGDRLRHRRDARDHPRPHRALHLLAGDPVGSVFAGKPTSSR